MSICKAEGADVIPTHTLTQRATGPDGTELVSDTIEKRCDWRRGQLFFRPDRAAEAVDRVQHIPLYANESQILLQTGMQAGRGGQRAGNAVEISAALGP